MLSWTFAGTRHSELAAANTRLTPQADAAESRASNPEAGLTAPVRLTSPTNAVSGGGRTPVAAEASAAAIARSQAGSSKRAPPTVAP